MTPSAKIIPLHSHPPPIRNPEQLYREACWRFLHVCFSSGALKQHIREAAEAMAQAKAKIGK